MKEWHKEAVALKRKGWTYRRMADHFGVSPSAVQWAVTYPRKPRPYIRVGPAQPKGRAKAIIETVCSITKQRQVDVLSRCKWQPYVDARFAIYHLLRTELGYNYSRIGRSVGRNHSTVMQGLKRLSPKQIELAAKAWRQLQALELFRPASFQPVVMHANPS